MARLATKTLTNSGSFTVPAGINTLLCFINTTPTFLGSFSQISAGAQFSVATRNSDGSAWAWGSNSIGQLGNNTTTDSASPVSVVGANSFTQIFARNSTLAIRGNDGSGWGWGSNTNGALGNNSVTSTSSPVSVLGAISFSKISTGGSSAGIRGSDGSMWCWGRGTSGELGDQTITNKSSPVSTVGAISFIQVACGNNGHTVAIRGSDGSAWAWGLGLNGRLGDNTVANKSSPVSVVGANSYIKIAAAGNFNAAIRGSDGSIWTWGQNQQGNIGDNATTTDKSSPVSVVGANSYIEVSCGGLSVLALRGSDGSAWAWGSNTNGQLGDRTIINRSSPVSVVGNHSFIHISAGSNHMLGLKSDGSVWAWGQDLSGELGGLFVPSTDVKAPVNISNISSSGIRCLDVNPNDSISVTFSSGVWTMISGNFTNILGFGEQLTLAWVE